RPAAPPPPPPPEPEPEPTPAPEPPPPPPPPSAPPPPPAPTDPHKVIFQDMVSKRVSEWDKMMGTSRHDERVKSFDVFKKLSEEEVNLAHRCISKQRLMELAELKVDYFSQLATQDNPNQRAECLKKFEEIGENEFALAKGVGPRGVQLEVPPVPVPPQPQPPQQQPPQPPQPQPPPAQSPPPQPPPQERPTRQFAQSTRMMAPVLPYRMPQMWPRMEDMMRMMPNDTGQAPKSPPEEDIDGKLKLLNQLESARGVLQKHPQGSSTSMADEIKRRLRKINRMQMQVIDDILGAKAEDSMFDIASELRPDPSDLEVDWEADQHQRLARKKSGTRPKGTRRSHENIKEKRKPKSVREHKSKVELPETSDEPVDISPRQRLKEQAAKCTKTTKYCPPQYEDDYEPSPETLWERPTSPSRPTYPAMPRRMREPPEDYYRGELDRHYEQHYAPPHEAYYEPPGHGYEPIPHHHDVGHYEQTLPHYHGQPDLPPGEMFPPHPIFSGQVVMTVPFEMGMTSQERAVSDVGVEVMPSIDDVEELPQNARSPSGRRIPKFLSKTTIIVNKKGSQAKLQGSPGTKHV
ncbi:unnamed protein product, partial [Ixodes hexagonus]